MVLQKRLDYGFNGYQVPAMPRATRSARRRGSFGKRLEDNKMCAFDLLATIAGKILLDGEISPTSSNKLAGKDHSAFSENNIKKEQHHEVRPLNIEPCDQNLKELPHDQHDASSSEKAVTTEMLVDDKRKYEIRSYSSKIEVDEMMKPVKVEQLNTGNVLIGTGPDKCQSDSSVKVSFCNDHTHGSFSLSGDDVKVVSRDDDENYSGCTQPSTSKKAFKPPPHMCERRIRKLLASKYWKVAPKLKGDDLTSIDGELRHVYRSRKSCYKRQRSQRNYPFKKRKLFNHSSASNFDGVISNGSISTLSEKGRNEDAHGAKRISSSMTGHHTSFRSRDSHVKLRIKSFRVPELFIEIPETATVGSLKRNVMEAVTAMLGGGLRVGLLLQGKKVRDDNRTLRQTGISKDGQLDALGFSLEPNPFHAPPQDSSFLLGSDSPQPLTRYPPASTVVQGASNASPDNPVSNFIESEHDSAPSPTDMSSIDKSGPDSKAIVVQPPMRVEALSVLPAQMKPNKSEIAHRRIRRPFSVSEVEALVQAVEKLGTGRWRDVKLRAFENSKHRTYVDLKDKWKTLVHTARISPQQRRGEPVPQELLNRVLEAHAYWAQHQAKQQLKQAPETCLLL